jgi:hypothetical protein
MGIDLNSGNYSFRTSYSYWNKLRRVVIESTLIYLQDIISKNTENTSPDYQNLLIDIKNFLKKLDEIKYYHNTNNHQEALLLHVIISLIKSNMSCLDTLIRIDAGGLFSLCYKSDCQGFYTPGNSLDICMLFDTIEPFVKEVDGYTYNAIYKKNDNINDCPGLYIVFEHSWKNLVNVIIS